MSTPKRIAVLVSGGGTNLQALIDAQNRGAVERIHRTRSIIRVIQMESNIVGAYRLQSPSC